GAFGEGSSDPVRRRSRPRCPARKPLEVVRSFLSRGRLTDAANGRSGPGFGDRSNLCGGLWRPSDGEQSRFGRTGSQSLSFQSQSRDGLSLLLPCQGEDVLIAGSLKPHCLLSRYSPCTRSVGKLTLKQSPSRAMRFVTGSHIAAGKLDANSSLYS